jgi:hypothetical protein
MAPNLAASQHAMIHDMIVSETLSAAQMADVAGCSKRSIKYIRSNLRCFGTTKAPPNGSGRRRSITPPFTSYYHLTKSAERHLYCLEVGDVDHHWTVIPERG